MGLLRFVLLQGTTMEQTYSNTHGIKSCKLRRRVTESPSHKRPRKCQATISQALHIRGAVTHCGATCEKVEATSVANCAPLSVSHLNDKCMALPPSMSPPRVGSNMRFTAFRRDTPLFRTKTYTSRSRLDYTCNGNTQPKSSK